MNDANIIRTIFTQADIFNTLSVEKVDFCKPSTATVRKRFVILKTSFPYEELNVQ